MRGDADVRAEYLQLAERHIQVERISKFEFFATIPGLRGLWGYGKTRKEAIGDIKSVIGEWGDICIKNGKDTYETLIKSIQTKEGVND